MIALQQLFHHQGSTDLSSRLTVPSWTSNGVGETEQRVNVSLPCHLMIEVGPDLQVVHDEGGRSGATLLSTRAEMQSPLTCQLLLPAPLL